MMLSALPTDAKTALEKVDVGEGIKGVKLSLVPLESHPQPLISLTCIQTKWLFGLNQHSTDLCGSQNPLPTRRQRASAAAESIPDLGVESVRDGG